MLKIGINMTLVLLMTGCTTKVIYETNPDLCLLFDIHYVSENDTETTKEQEENYNDLYQRVCNENRD